LLDSLLQEIPDEVKPLAGANSLKILGN